MSTYGYKPKCEECGASIYQTHLVERDGNKYHDYCLENEG